MCDAVNRPDTNTMPDEADFSRSLPAPPGAPAALSQALLETELERLAASAAFRQSPRHVRFLRHLVHATLAGDMARLREMALGVEVFYRPESRFDPRQDSIVRVEARRLRQKLARYYTDEGRQARLEFSLPVGQYAVMFRHRSPERAGDRHRVAVGVMGLTAVDDPPGLCALAATLTAELVGALTRLNGLRVVPLDPQAQAPSGPQIRRAGRRVNVTSVVHGVLRAGADGQALHIALQLTRVEDLHLLWARQVQADPADPIGALEPLARGVVAELHREAAEHQLQRITRSGSHPLLPGMGQGGPSRATLDRLSLARLAMRLNSPEGYHKAAALCEQAVADEPHYAPAFALLGDALMGGVGLTALPSLPTLESVRRAAVRCIELDPTLADPHDLLGQVHFTMDHDVPSALAELLHALRLAPASARVHARHGWVLMMNRRFAEARSSYAEARDLDPLSALYRVHDALITLYEKDWERAALELDAVLDVVPDHLVALALRAALCLYAGAVDEGLRRYEHLVQRFPKLSIGRCGLAQAHALAGDEASARRELDRLQAIYDAGAMSPYQLAMVQARLQAPEAAAHWLVESARLRDFNFVCVGVDPAFDSLRGREDFRLVLQANGMGHLVGP